MPQRFGEWLADQQDREDEVGYLARALVMQKAIQEQPGRRLDEHKVWADIVIRIIEPGYVAVFNGAWQEFLVDQQRAQDAAA